jgi:hypothetical protein
MSEQNASEKTIRSAFVRFRCDHCGGGASVVDNNQLLCGDCFFQVTMRRTITVAKRAS